MYVWVIFYSIQQDSHFLGKRKNTTTFLLSYKQWKWTSEVQIYIPVAKRKNNLHQSMKFINVTCNHLWTDTSILIVFRQYVTKITSSYFSLLQSNKRGVISLDTAKVTSMSITISSIRISLQWSEKNRFHYSSILY